MSGRDPTVLYLANRKGWLVSPKRLIGKTTDEWRALGADAIAGSYEVVESFQTFEDGVRKQRLKQWLCSQPGGCQQGPTFVIRLTSAPTITAQ